jgi:hypothetical protein
MATGFWVYDGIQHGTGDDLPWPQCVEAFKVDEACWTEHPPREPQIVERHFPFPDRIVIRVKEPEAPRHGIKPGFFLFPLCGLEAKFELDRVRETDGNSAG